jgi:hypothetical protein
MDMDIHGPTAIQALASYTDSVLWRHSLSGAGREVFLDWYVFMAQVPSIEDGLLDDYGGYDLRYRSSLHPVFLCIHLWMLTYMYGIAPYN